MPDWTLIERGIRQGCFLSCADKNLSADAKQSIQNGRAIEAHRNKPITEKFLLLVLTQDCDIHNPSEHYIEILAISKVTEKKIAVAQHKNRNYKKLQLPIQNEYWQCNAELISIVHKDILENEDLFVAGNIEKTSLEILVDWRVGRYKRRPLPHRFNLDFLSNYLKAEENPLDAFLKRHRDTILDLFVYVSPANVENAEEYTVSVTALLDENCNSELRDEIDKELRRHWTILHETQNSLKMIQIDPSVENENNFDIFKAISAKSSDITVYEIEQLTRLCVDYLCYSDDDE